MNVTVVWEVYNYLVTGISDLLKVCVERKMNPKNYYLINQGWIQVSSKGDQEGF